MLYGAMALPGNGVGIGRALNGASREITFASLMVRAFDEPDALYGLAAARVRHDDRKKYFQFVLRKGARFHDGSPMTPEDVVWTFNTLREKGHPMYRSYYGDVTEIE